MMNLGKKLGFAVLLAFGGALSAQASVLDTFTYTTDLTVNGNGDSDTEQKIGVTETSPAGDVLYTLLMLNDTNGAPSGTSTAAAVFADGKMYYSEAPETDARLTLYYNDISVEAAVAAELVANGPAAALALAALSAQDFTDGGTSTDFYFDVVFSAEGFDLALTVTDIYGNSATDMLDNIAAVASPGTRLFLSFAGFAGVDLTKVASVTAIIDSAPGSDLTLSEVGTTSVPEPATVAIFGLALVGFAFSSKRKEK